TMLRVSGPAVRHLAEVFQSSWHRASHSLSPLPLPAASTAGVTCLQVLSSAGRQGRRPIQRSLRQTIARATGRCFLTPPYFLPQPRLDRALVLAARRGVDVRVLTAGISDVPLVRRASRHLYARLLRRGVRIFEYEKRTLHAKTVVIDGVYASVGTFNLDHWSWRRLLEVNVSAIGPQVATALEAQFHEDLRDSSEVTLQLLEDRGILERLVDWSAWLLLRW
ncbi:MAG: phospholipase D-like domain-containing protein, partial [Myxococcota bacterium]